MRPPFPLRFQEDEQRTDSEAGRGFQDMTTGATTSTTTTTTTTTKSEHHPPPLLCDWCDADAEETTR